nr:cysteine--tRNA ligase [Microcoleaceae cyanobacterium MO_207.B10]
TQTIDGIQQLIQNLEEKGFAYPSGGDVYYQVRKFSKYGKLSGRRLEEMQAGASGRVESEDSEITKKKDPFDFALWKAAKAGEPAWDSPWGKGRPGWHIECSAMVKDCLGETIDIHAGGADLTFPHHENEIAQSEAATGKSYVKYWLHNGFVTINGEKMSKSLGNFTTIRDLLARPVDPMAVRMFVLTAQYRKPIDFTKEAIASAENGWNTIKEGILFSYQYGSKLGWEIPEKILSGKIELLSYQVEQFQKAMDDDINTPGALAVLFELAKELRRQGNILVHEGKTEIPLEELQKQWVTLVNLAKVLGLEVQPDSEINQESNDLSDGEIESLIQQRLQAKKAKNYAEADRIRDELQNQGIKLIDRPGGVTNWHRN